MSPALEDELFKKYPKIFNGSLIKRHIECGDGWYVLLDSLCTAIQGTLDRHQDLDQVRAVRIKHINTGGLAFDYSGGDLNIFELISNAENHSFHVCELCGGRGDLNITKSGTKCLCQKCKENESMPISKEQVRV